MSPIQNALDSAALTVLRTFGAAATLSSVTRTYNPTTGNETTTKTDYPVKVSPPAPMEQKTADGSTVRSRTLTCYLAASGLAVVPVPNNFTLTVGSIVFRIVAARPYYGGDSVTLYELELEA